jgi:hypothetical protein
MRRLGQKRFLAGVACGLTGIGLRKKPSAQRRQSRGPAMVFDFRTFSYAYIRGPMLVSLRDETTRYFSYDTKPLAALDEGADGNTELKAVAEFAWQGGHLQDMVSRTIYDSSGQIVAMQRPGTIPPAPACDANGSVEAMDGPRDEYWQAVRLVNFVYDAQGRLCMEPVEIHPAPLTTFAYDGDAGSPAADADRPS